MGEVCRARDGKLNREVAIKGLPAALANNAQYMARFEREAQTLAALNHPNIATVYGVEQGALMKAPTCAVRCRWKKPSPSPGKSPKVWKRPTNAASSIAT